MATEASSGDEVAAPMREHSVVALVPIDGIGQPTDPRKARLCGALSYLRYDCVTVSPPTPSNNSGRKLNGPRYAKYVASCAQALHEMIEAPNGSSPLTNGREQWVICFLRPLSVIPLHAATQMAQFFDSEIQGNVEAVLVSSDPEHQDPQPVTLVGGRAINVHKALLYLSEANSARSSPIVLSTGAAAPFCAVVNELNDLCAASSTSKNVFVQTSEGDNDQTDEEHDVSYQTTQNADAPQKEHSIAVRTPPAIELRMHKVVPAFIAFSSATEHRKRYVEQLWDAMFETGLSPEMATGHVQAQRQRTERLTQDVGELDSLQSSVSSARSKRLIAQRKARQGINFTRKLQTSRNSTQNGFVENDNCVDHEDSTSYMDELPQQQSELVKRARQLMVMEPESPLARAAMRALREKAPAEATRLETLSTAWRSGIAVKQKDLRMFLRQAAVDRLRPAIAAHNRALERGIRDVSDRRSFKPRDRARASKGARLRAHADSMDMGTRGRWSMTRLQDSTQGKLDYH